MFYSAEFSRRIELEKMRELAELDWHDQTSYLDKAQDIELLGATGYDFKFLNIHHKVRDLIDAVRTTEDIDQITYDTLYNYLSLGKGEQGNDRGIFLNKVDDAGRATGEERVDIFRLARFKKIKQYNEYLMDDAFTDEELDSWYNSDDITKLKKTITNKKTGQQVEVDLLKIVPEIEITKDDFSYYREAIDAAQVPLQLMSNYREDGGIELHHAENAGHAQMKRIAGENLFIPVGIVDAANYVRIDVKKYGEPFKAAGHPHEFGWFEENTGTLVKIEAEAYSIWRKGISLSRVHEKTTGRVLSNILALSSGEKNKSINKDGQGSFHFGDSGRGDIYKGMRHHYNKKLEKVRGYGITNEEIGDKIVTDIVGVFFAINPLDFLMTFAKVTGIGTAEKIIVPPAINGTGEWKDMPKFVFDAKYPQSLGENPKVNADDIKDIKPDANYTYGKITLVGVPALREYIQWRISRGDISGIDKDTILVVKGITEEEQKKREAELEEEEEGAGEVEIKEYTEDFKQGIAYVFKNIFGAEQAKEYLQSFIDGNPKTRITIDGTDYDISGATGLARFILKRIEEIKLDTEFTDKIQIGITKANLGDKFFEMLGLFGEMTNLKSENRKKVVGNIRSIMEKLNS